MVNPVNVLDGIFEPTPPPVKYLTVESSIRR
jgi:hypothetical protein